MSKIWESMRQFTGALEDDGELKRVSVEVDPAWELSSVARQIFDWPEEQRPALLFEQVKGYRSPVAVALFGNRRRCARALGCSVDEIGSVWRKALANPMPVRMVPDGPCHENIFMGEEANLFSLPIPVWTPDKDAGPYLTAPCVITKDPETGVANVGTYRCHVQGPRRIGINIHRERHVGINLTKWEQLGREMEVAICLGPDPAVAFTSVGQVPFGKDELAVAGALAGEGIEVVKCRTVDLAVPATTEIVIEGFIPLGETVTEGPFGEMSGYMGLRKQSPLVKVTAITYRNDYVFHAFISQRPPSESSMLRKCLNEQIILQRIKDLGIPGVVDLCLPEAASSSHHGIISITNLYPAHPREVMLAAWAVGRGLFRQIVIVDDDIDVRNPFEVEWAISTRCRPDKDIVIIPEHITSLIDPIQTPEDQKNRAGGVCAKYGLDATKSHEYSPVALPDQQYLERVKNNWAKYDIGPLSKR